MKIRLLTVVGSVADAVKNEMKNGLSGAVIVGMDNSGKTRENELTPKSIGKMMTENEKFVVEMSDEMYDDLIEINKDFYKTFSAPEAEIFDDFLVNTVMPYVEENFPVISAKAQGRFAAVLWADFLLFTRLLLTAIFFRFRGCFLLLFCFLKRPKFWGGLWAK